MGTEQKNVVTSLHDTDVYKMVTEPKTSVSSLIQV